MDGWRLITHQFSSKAFIRCSGPDWGPALPNCSRNQNQGKFLSHIFSTWLHGQCMVGSVLRMVSITPLQVPGMCQEHSDGFLAAAVGFSPGHHKVWIPTRPSIQREGGSPLAQPQHRLKKSLTGYPEGRTHPSCGGNHTHGARGNSFHTEPLGLWLVECPHQGAGGGKQGWQKQRAALSKTHPEQ